MGAFQMVPYSLCSALLFFFTRPRALVKSCLLCREQDAILGHSLCLECSMGRSLMKYFIFVFPDFCRLCICNMWRVLWSPAGQSGMSRQEPEQPQHHRKLCLSLQVTHADIFHSLTTILLPILLWFMVNFLQNRNSAEFTLKYTTVMCNLEQKAHAIITCTFRLMGMSH